MKTNLLTKIIGLIYSTVVCAQRILNKLYNILWFSWKPRPQNKDSKKDPKRICTVNYKFPQQNSFSI